MFSLTRKTEYALLALARLAQEPHEASGRTTGGNGHNHWPVGKRNALSAREVANEHGLPLPVVMNVLKALHRAGLAGSVRGVHGGYRLARPPHQITVRRVIEAIEGSVQVTLCCHPTPSVDDAPVVGLDLGAPGHPLCHLLSRCRISPAIRQLHARLEAFLGQVTLADLLAEDAPRRIDAAADREHPREPPPAVPTVVTRPRPCTRRRRRTPPDRGLGTC